MSKKILALLLSLMMILSQSTLCFGEVLAGDEGADGPVLESIVAKPETLNVPPYSDNALLETFVANNIKVTAAYDDQSTGTIEKTDFTVAVAENTATVTYNEKTATVALSQSAVTTEPIVLDFEDDMGGMTAANWNADNVLDLSLEDGALKCDYTYVTGERSYLYLPLDNVDGAFYDTMKITAKVKDVENAPGNLRMYYIGANKTTAEHCGENSLRYKTFAYEGAVESEGVYSNTDYQEYTIDFSTEANWKDLYLSKIRIDGLHNKSGIVYIDSIELYNKELHTVKEPINFEFETDLDGVTVFSTNGFTVVAEDGKLKGELTATERYLYVPLSGADGSYYDTMDIRIKVTSAQDNGLKLAKNAYFGMFYKGTSKTTGETVSEAGSRQRNLQIKELTENEGVWSNSDFVKYTIDLSTLTSWSDTYVERLRIDPLKNIFGTFEIDYIRLYHKEAAPVLTGIEVSPETLSVPYANQDNVLDFVKGAITGVTATYSNGSTNAVTEYAVAVDRNVATVTYEGFTDTIALTMEPEPQVGAPIVWDFESNMTGVTVLNWNSNVLTASPENGALKCDYSYESGERSYLYIALDDIDGAYYDTLKIRAKIASVNTATQTLRVFFAGEDKTTQEAYSESGARGRNVTYAALTENNGVYSHSDYTEYEIDLSAIAKWSDSYISRVRIDALANATGVLYIDSIGFYHKEAAPVLTGIEVSPETLSVPYANQADIIGFVRGAITGVTATYSDGSSAPVTGYTVAINGEVATVTYQDKTATIALTYVEEVIPPTPDDEVAEGEEFILYDFNEGTENFVKYGDVEISQIVTDDGITALEYISSVDTAAGKTETGYITKNVNLNPGQVYKIEMRVKFVGVTPVFGYGTTPAYNVIYAGSIDGKEFVGDSHHLIDGTYSNIELTEGEYWSKDGDWHIVTIDPTKANGTKTKKDGTVVEVNWGKSIIEQIRFDILKKSNGIVLVDYIKMYSVPSVTDIVFDNGGISASAVPVGTEKITLTLSDSLYEVKKNAVSVVSADGVSAEVKGVSHEKSTNKVVITIGELDSMTDYAVLINSNALANERQSLYKAIKATFTTEKGELECNAAGDGNSAEFTFVNAGESKNVVLVATVWDGDKYVGKYTQPYQIAAGDTTYTFNYSSVLGGDRAEVAVWDYADGTVKTVYGKKVFTFDR